MNYRHHFHAGNHADVLKHTVLVSVLDRLCAKDKPLVYLETHAGAGRYALHQVDSDAPGIAVPEYVEGVLALAQAPLAKAPRSVRRYLELVQRYNPAPLPAGLRCYPGSPLLASAVLREQDHLRLAELAPEAAHELMVEMQGDHRVQVHTGDGYAALRAWLPPQPRRGVVMLDPPYERADEFQQLAAAVADAHRRWPVGVLVVWYPIKAYSSLQPWLRQMAALPASSVLLAELCVHPDDTTLRLNGSGMLIVQPPWQLDVDLRGMLPALHQALTRSRNGRCTVRWLKAPEGSAEHTLKGPRRGPRPFAP